jgi:aspartyl-tRNA(Asn)/glutamyl-tRNA(Gln) amidotransferase subunit A
MTAAAAVHSGATTCRELVEKALARIAWAADQLPVMAALDEQVALAAAARRDAETPRSPLHGLPVVLKDAIDVAGLPTRGGSRLVDHHPRRTAALAQRIEDAGLVIVGKARQQELAFGGWGTHALEGTLRNPWDAQVHRVPGGSSSGCAVAVAAGLVPLAVGTDTGGSVRIPASMCGLVGLRPHVDAVPLDGVMPLCPGLDAAGPIAATVGDTAALYQVMAGIPVTGATPAALHGLRLGRWNNAVLGELQPAVADAYEASLLRLQEQGALLSTPARIATSDEFKQRAGVLLGYRAWRAYGELVSAAPERMDPAVLARFRNGASVTGADYRDVLQRQVEDRRTAATLFADIDAMVVPTTPITAAALAEVDESRTPLAGYTRWVNYLGLCSVAVPAGLSPDGLPLSLQFVLPAGSEQLALDIAASWEALAPPLPFPPLSAFGAEA